ncbi:MAG: hypothetical protein JWO63_1548 [Frankiales bacterium]|nr:hypothetical protein [Frankiales bacterium]
MTTKLSLEPAIEAHVAAVNRFDIDAIMDTFTADALVNDASREFWGTERIRAWITKEMVGDHVTLEPVEVANNDGFTPCAASTTATTTRPTCRTR